jgi:quinohemoprotein ethanol dehydrogenase
LESLYGKLPSLAELSGGGETPKSRGLIRAYNPTSGKLMWEQQTHSLWDGGILSTAGNLVARGDTAGDLKFYAADSGKLLHTLAVGTSIMAAPMTYRIGDVQYISVMAAYGGGVLFNPFPQDSAAYQYGNEGRIVTFRLDGGAVPKPAPVVDHPPEHLPAREGTATTIAQGELLYNRFCSRCHAFGRALLPDLRRLSPATHAMFYQIVLEGAYQVKGMARWDDVLTRADVEAIHAYLVDQEWQLEQDRAAVAK